VSFASTFQVPPGSSDKLLPTHVLAALQQAVGSGVGGLRPPVVVDDPIQGLKDNPDPSEWLLPTADF
jgi:hypothetical protein